MWEQDLKEDWVPKNSCFSTVVLEKIRERPLVSKELKRVNPKRNQSWIFIERTNAEAEAPVLWPPDVKEVPKERWCDWDRNMEVAGWLENICCYIFGAAYSLLGRKVMAKLDSILKSRDITLSTKVRLSQGCGFSSSQVWMWELDYKESWAQKNWCFWTVVLEKTLESLLAWR